MSHLAVVTPKFFKKVKNTKGQALLLVTISSLVFLVIVLAILDRTNRQLNVQRQNAEYIIAFNRVLSATDAVVSVINSGVSPYDSTALNARLNPTTGNPIIPCGDSGGSTTICEYKVSVDAYDGTKDLPSVLSSDQSLTVSPFDRTGGSTVSSFIVWCDLSKSNSAVVLQILYKDSSSNLQSESFATSCKDTANTINGGANWNYGSDKFNQTLLGSTGFSVYNDTAGVGVNITNPQTGLPNSYLRLIYNVPAAKTNIYSIRVIPKVGFFANGSTATSAMLRMYGAIDLGGTIVGSSNPVTGTAIGYGKSGRTSTVKFSIPSTVKLPVFFDYVLFEGQ